LRITRFPSISEQQFLGCVSAFADSFTGELNSALIALRRLEGRRKGSAFAYEMTLDNHRYGALIVLDRWNSLVSAFGPYLLLGDRQAIVTEGAARTTAAEQIITRANQLVDSSADYSPQIVEACALAFQTAQAAFAEERDSAARNAKLGPMLSSDYTEARQIFLEDLAAR
jgi:hypothetical protein